MRRKWIFVWLSLIFIPTFLNSLSWAGEVVTKELRTWAQKMIDQEKAVKAPLSPNTMAVPYFQNKTGQSELDPLQKGIALMLTTDLSNVKGFQVLERARFQALVEELGLGASGLVEPHAAPRVGRLLGAYWLVGGLIAAGKGNQILIQSTPLEVPTQKILGQSLSEGDLSDLFRMEKDLLFEIIKLLKIEVTPEEEKGLRKPCSTNIKALMAMFKGIDASDRQNYKQAAEFYEMALKEDSNICTVKGALKELKDLGLIGGNKKSSDLLRSLRDRSSLTDQLTPEDATKRERTPGGISPSEIRTLPSPNRAD